MAAVADVDGNSAKLGLEDGVAGVALHVVGGLGGGAENISGSVSKVRSHSLTSLKSPIRGMWFLRLFPRTVPELETTTAVFHRVPCSSSRSRMGDTTTMLCFLASCRHTDKQRSGLVRV